MLRQAMVRSPSLVFFLALGCTGMVESPAGPVDPDGVAQGVDGAGPLPLQRLGRTEYVNTVRDLLGAELLASSLPSDTLSPTGFRVPGTISTTEANRFMSAAEGLGPHIADRLDTLLPCDPQRDGEHACARTFIEVFGLRAYRRPLSPPEVEDLHDHYARVRSELGYGFRDAVRVVVQSMLQSPNFLYRWELGPRAPSMEGRVVRLDPYELASRLSYFIWRTMPDDTLFRAAAEGDIADADTVRMHARRMLSDPRARDTIADFHLQWLHVEVGAAQKDPALFPDFDDGLRDSMGREMRAFVTNHVLDGDGRLDTLFLSPVSYIDGPLARLYGVDGVEGNELQEATLDPSQRFGLLTQAAFLTSHATSSATSPVQRGVVVLERLLCEPAPPPPAGIEIVIPEPDPTLQTRELYIEHASNPACSGCHALMDPFGFAFEGYDAIGRFRTEENDRPVDTTGVASIDGSERSFDGARDLVELLVASDALRHCVAKKWMRFMLGRHETTEEEGSFEEAFGAFTASDDDVRELIVALTGTRTFLYRAPAAGEVIP
jgi:hypothetical protein